jgi:hypothetical protein
MPREYLLKTRVIMRFATAVSRSVRILRTSRLGVRSDKNGLVRSVGTCFRSGEADSVKTGPAGRTKGKGRLAAAPLASADLAFGYCVVNADGTSLVSLNLRLLPSFPPDAFSMVLLTKGRRSSDEQRSFSPGSMGARHTETNISL